MYIKLRRQTYGGAEVVYSSIGPSLEDPLSTREVVLKDI